METREDGDGGKILQIFGNYKYRGEEMGNEKEECRETRARCKIVYRRRKEEKLCEVEKGYKIEERSSRGKGERRKKERG